MKKLLFALLPTIISRILQARKAKQMRAGQAPARPATASRAARKRIPFVPPRLLPEAKR
jgi:hypothetical protein